MLDHHYNCIFLIASVIAILVLSTNGRTYPLQVYWREVAPYKPWNVYSYTCEVYSNWMLSNISITIKYVPPSPIPTWLSPYLLNVSCISYRCTIIRGPGVWTDWKDGVATSTTVWTAHVEFTYIAAIFTPPLGTELLCEAYSVSRSGSTYSGRQSQLIQQLNATITTTTMAPSTRATSTKKSTTSPWAYHADSFGLS